MKNENEVNFDELQIDKENSVVSYKCNKKDVLVKSTSGIYQIYFPKDNKIYIGSSVNMLNRIMSHLYKLRYNKHENFKMQKLYDKYSEKDIIFETLEECDKDYLFEKEQYYVDNLHPSINIRIIEVNTRRGIPHSIETKNKISNSNKGKTVSEYQKYAVSESNKRRVVSEDTKKKQSDSHKGHITSEDTKQKIRNAQGTKVVQLDKNLNLIKTWNSMGECKCEGYAHSAISEVCSGKRKSHKGYVWMTLVKYESYITKNKYDEDRQK